MKLRLPLILLLLAILPSISFAQDKALFTVADIFDSDKFEEETLDKAQWIPSTDAFTFLETDEIDSVVSIIRHDVVSGDESVLIDGHMLHTPNGDSLLEIVDYAWSEDGLKILLETDTEEIWRHSTECHFYIYEIGDKTLTPVFEGDERISNTLLSPDGAMVGYVYENDIYIKDFATGETKQLTHDGSDDTLNGKFDWAYEEEFGISQGWEWSPDGNRIAFWWSDQSLVPEFSWIDYNPLHLETTMIKYPKSGETVAVVKIGVIDLESGTTTWMDIGPDTNMYVPRIKWTNNPDLLAIQRLNRHQNHLDLLLADVRTGETEILLTESDPCFVDVHDNLTFVNGTDQFLWTSERDGHNHIYLYSLENGLERQLTSGDWEVTGLYGVDEDRATVYYCSNQQDVTERHVCAVGLNGGTPERLTVDPGWHMAVFSDDYRYFIDNWSNVRTPKKSILSASDGTAVRTLVENEISVLEEYTLSYPEFFTIETSDGATLNARMIKPANFDETRKYPVLVTCYGGPGGRVVNNRWRTESFLWQSIFVQHGYVIFSVDNRGIGGRGKDLANLAYRDLAKWAVHDQIEGARYLAELPYVDSNRIGIYGWSFGGYLTFLAMTLGSDHFSVGVSGAPVTCWTLYDAIYTERYMGLPAENTAGYDSASVFSYIDRLKGDLLIIHGASDDNVHLQNTMKLAEALQKAGKQFDLMIYPGKNHGVDSDDDDDKTDLHLHTLITEYILTISDRFAMQSPVRNILITGLPGTGKTTPVKQICTELEEYHPVGFITEEIRTGGVRQGFNLIPIGVPSCPQATLSHIHIAGRPRVGKYGVDVSGFETFLQTLTPAVETSQLVVIDEIGKMECLPSEFPGFISRLLESEQILLVTIALKGGGLIAEAKQRSDVMLLEITKENRVSMTERVCLLLRQLL